MSSYDIPPGKRANDFVWCVETFFSALAVIAIIMIVGHWIWGW